MVADREGRKFTLLKRRESPESLFSGINGPILSFFE